MTFKVGEIKGIVGVWENDELKKCKKLKLDQDQEADNYNPVSGLLEGDGTVIVGIGEKRCKYVGKWDFVSGKLQGLAKVFDANDNLIFEGNFRDGIRQGIGKYIWPGQGEYEGPYMNGIRQTSNEQPKGKMVWHMSQKQHVFEGTFDENGQCASGLLDNQ